MSELGNKHECLGCGTKFYDLGKSELICPKCGENQKDLAAAQDSSAGKETQRKKKKSTKSKAKAKKKKTPAPKETESEVANKKESEDAEAED